MTRTIFQTCGSLNIDGKVYKTKEKFLKALKEFEL